MKLDFVMKYQRNLEIKDVKIRLWKCQNQLILSNEQIKWIIYEIANIIDRNVIWPTDSLWITIMNCYSMWLNISYPLTQLIITISCFIINKFMVIVFMVIVFIVIVSWKIKSSQPNSINVKLNNTKSDQTSEILKS